MVYKKKSYLMEEVAESIIPNERELERDFPGGIYPKGEWLVYDNVRTKENGEESRMLEREIVNDHNDLRKAAEVHRRVRKELQSKVRLGMSLIELCETVENGTRSYLGEDRLKAGIGFPTGCSLNNCAAHDTPNSGDERVLQADDVCKVDFGTHVNGMIIDSAFTVSFNPIYLPLHNATKEATYAGIRAAGVDTRLYEIGEIVEEIIESYEIEKDGKIYPIKSIRNLCGHSIERYKIHGGKSVPNARGGEEGMRMEEGEVFAIETFASTGKGWIREEGDCSHYMRSRMKKAPIRLPKAKALLKTIETKFKTLPFCRRYLDRLGESNYILSLRQLARIGLIDPYPPLCDIVGSYTSQHEHTILIQANGVEILSKGEDY